MFRRREKILEVFIVHPGGPFWAKKDLGAWSIPKGEYADGENPLATARREFAEETGMKPDVQANQTGLTKHLGGKLVKAWAFEGDYDPSKLRTDLCLIPAGQKVLLTVPLPEIDRGGWFPIG